MKFLYQFSAGKSFVHSLDPRTKLVLILFFLIATFIIPRPWIMPLLIMAVLWVGAKVKPTEYYVFLLFLLPLMIGVTLIHLLTDPGPYFFSALGFVHLSTPGLQAGLSIAFRLAAMGLAFMLFSMTTDPFDWGLAMYKSGLPYRLAFMFAFAMRVFPLIQEELTIIRNALAARAYEGIDSANPVAFLRGAVISMFPLIAGALRRSQEIAMAMELRGLTCAEEMKVRRTVFRDIGLRRRDYATMAVGFSCLVAFMLYSAQTGALPSISRGWILFGVVLVALFSIVGWRIANIIMAD
jgi:energy-coupling factor transport system permease protein